MSSAGAASRARRGSRDLLVQAIYQWQIAETGEDELLEQFAESPDFAHIDQTHFRRLLGLVVNEHAAFDSIIAGHAERSTAELDPIGRAVLLVALAELRELHDVPTRVAINEAVELTKRYGAAQSYRFVNAVLDKASRQLRPATGEKRE